MNLQYCKLNTYNIIQYYFMKEFFTKLTVPSQLKIRQLPMGFAMDFPTVYVSQVIRLWIIDSCGFKNPQLISCKYFAGNLKNPQLIFVVR